MYTIKSLAFIVVTNFRTKSFVQLRSAESMKMPIGSQYYAFGDRKHKETTQLLLTTIYEDKADSGEEFRP